MMNERYIIDTPEHIAFSYAVAGIGSRFLAAIIDTLLLLFAQLLLIGVFLLALSQVDLLPREWRDNVPSMLLAVWGVLSFAIFWGYYLFFELIWNGQSPGKRLVRLRVVREGGRPITFVASAIRNLIRFVDFLPSLYGIGVLVMFIDRHSRRLGDLAGGTLVVKDRVAVTLDSLKAQSVKPPVSVASSSVGNIHEPGSSVQSSIPNIQLLSENDYNLVQEFLRRRNELGQASRVRLGEQLAQQISASLGITLNRGLHEQLLEQVVAEYRRLKG